MTDVEAKLASAAAIEQYAKVMEAKGLRARARWAQQQALRLRRLIEGVRHPDARAA